VGLTEGLQRELERQRERKRDLSSLKFIYSLKEILRESLYAKEELKEQHQQQKS
jgi:hypothetical protein